MARIDGDDDDDRPRSRGRDDEDDADDDDHPRRRKRRDDDDYDRPKSGGGNAGKIILIVVVVAFVALLACGGIAYLLIMPAITKVREAASRVEDMNHFKQISMGMHNLSDRTGNLPPADGDLSWRVHLLPFIQQESLLRQFDMQQPWNKGKNQQLGDTFIKTYQSPLDDPPTSQTHYRVFTGEGTAFDPKFRRGGGLTFIADGTSNTILIIETAETVPWPAPKEVPLQQGGIFPEFGHPKRTTVIVATCDGAVKSFDKKAMDAVKMRALATAAGGEPIADW